MMNKFQSNFTNKLYRVLLLMVLNAISHCIYPQNYQVKKYTVEDGLLLNQTGKLFQDERGYLWITYLTGDWQIFDDKKFRTIPCKGSFGFDFLASGTKVYTWAHYGHFEITNYSPRFFPLDTNLYETQSGFGYANLNRRAFNPNGDLYILKLNSGKPNQYVTSIDTIYKKNGGVTKYILCDYFKGDTSVKFDFAGIDSKNIWITTHNLKNYKCVGLFKIEGEKIVKVNYNPQGEISAIYNDKHERTWILWKSPINLNYYITLLDINNNPKEYNLGKLGDAGGKLITDNKGNLWLPYLRGLVKVDPTKARAEHFEDRERVITIEYEGTYGEFGRSTTSSVECDHNYYKIAVTSENEVICGNKLFTEEKGFVKLLDNGILGAGALTSCMVDSEDNIWYSGNGLVKVSRIPVKRLAVRDNFKLMYVTPTGKRLGYYLNEKSKNTYLLAYNENGKVIDSVLAEPYGEQELSFFNTRHSTVLCLSKTIESHDFINFDGSQFQKINGEACNFSGRKDSEPIVFGGSDSSLLYLKSNRLFMLQGLKMIEITSKINKQLAFKRPERCGFRSPVYSNFNGIIDSNGIYVYENNNFRLIPFFGSGIDANEKKYICQIPNKKNNLTIILSKRRKVFLFDGKQIKEIQCNPEEVANFTYDYISHSFWLNDSVFIAANEKKLSKWTLTNGYSKLGIQEITTVPANEDVSERYYLANSWVFYRPFLQDIKYFRTEDLSVGKVTVHSIPNTAIKGNFFFNELSYYDQPHNTFYYKDGAGTSFIDFTNFNINLHEATLSIVGLKWTVEDSVYYNSELTAHLPYNFNPLRINYKGICLTDGKKVRYRYFLKGLDNSWQDSEEDFVSYSTLPSGQYTFCVVACNNDGLWNKNPMTISFVVKPPWYMTWTAYFVFGTIAVSLIFLLMRIRTRKLIREKQNLEKIIAERTQELVHQKHLIEEKQNEILDSINYAQRIQRSMLASEKLLKNHLTDYFILYLPKDIVSGDFYWASVLSNGEFALLIADSTGHGVPGAIMSMLNIACLNEAVDGFKLVQANDILNSTRVSVIKHLSNDGSIDGGKDGMDCSLLVIDGLKLKFAAANNPVWIVRKNELIELEPDRMPVGKHERESFPFNQLLIDLLPEDMVYALTDGYPDQFGGPKGKKFMYKQLKDLLINISTKPINEQKEILSKCLLDWKGSAEQVDDITIIGFRI